MEDIPGFLDRMFRSRGVRWQIRFVEPSDPDWPRHNAAHDSRLSNVSNSRHRDHHPAVGGTQNATV